MFERFGDDDADSSQPAPKDVDITQQHHSSRGYSRAHAEVAHIVLKSLRDAGAGLPEEKIKGSLAVKLQFVHRCRWVFSQIYHRFHTFHLQKTTDCKST